MRPLRPGPRGLFFRLFYRASTYNIPMDRNSAMRFILMMGLVSLFGDMAYEGGRSMTGPFMAFLGASAAVVGVVSGLGEFLGYSLRLVFGLAADRTRAYWPLTFLGYGLTFAIPFLALAGTWQAAAAFIILERVGKAIRSPARDAILSYATKQVGRGWGFAIHEAMDQIGAIAGPLIFAGIFAWKNSYRAGFGVLAVPAALMFLFLVLSRARARSPEDFEAMKKAGPLTQAESRFSASYRHYAAFSFLCVAGFINFQIISYHWKAQAMFPMAWIPLIYALAMGVDAAAALAVGKAYDRWGLKTLGLIPLFTVCVPVLVFLPAGLPAAAGVAVVWGVIMGMHETVMRAAIADLTHIQKRGFGYGLFNALYGAAWFFGSSMAGWLYDRHRIFVFLFVFVVELAAFAVFWKYLRKPATKPAD